jgi:hypothetical protein
VIIGQVALQLLEPGPGAIQTNSDVVYVDHVITCV